MSGLAGVVAAMKEHQGSDVEASPSTVKDSGRQQVGRLKVPPKRRSSGYTSAPGSPAGRTGPPSSSFPISPSLPTGRSKEQNEAGGAQVPSIQVTSNGETSQPPSATGDESTTELTDPYRKRFAHTSTGFRSAWEYEEGDTPKPKTSRTQRDSWLDVDAWNPIKWIAGGEGDKDANQEAEIKEKPEEEDAAKEQGTSQASQTHPLRSESPANIPEETELKAPAPDVVKLGRLPRSFSLHTMKNAPTWNRLKALLPAVGGNAVEPPSTTLLQPDEKRDVDLVHEVTYSGLAPLMLRMWFERDERDERRVPILMEQLKIRVSDSIYPLSNSKAVFRIECEYANGAARWVIYRQLTEFRKLNRHYRLANFYTLSKVKLPDFQRSALSKIHFYRLKREKGSTAARAEYAKMQREILENYLIGLIRAVVCGIFAFLMLNLNTNRCLKQVLIALLVSWRSRHFLSHYLIEEGGSLKPEFLKSKQMEVRKTMGGRGLAGRKSGKVDGQLCEKAI